MLKKAVLDQLSEDAVIVLEFDRIEVEIPVSILKGHEDVEFIFGDVNNEVISKNSNAISGLYDFTLSSNGEAITFTETPITLTFDVDQEKVKNWKNVRVFYIDENGVKQEEITPTKYDSSTGEVIAEVTHFSIYGAFEIADDEVKVGEGQTEVDDQTGKDKLPDTATNQYNWFVIGLLLVVIGSVAFYVARRRNGLNL
ncbi:LPXTG cell wall anchor domain-containing protein [Bacillus sp. YZJH907-2]|uniref:LPXTG cell wall anchor domain-containing protein n=1 Tax=Halalkalibacter suaedae TaxID=2822140 RepID=A0A940WTT5_9BACI|nr:LPXTG cell wall anchor domain-containing protein [Bacillus suaedae]